MIALVCIALLLSGNVVCQAKAEKQYDISKQDVIISKSGKYTITGSTDKHTIIVREGVTADITLKNVTIINPSADRSKRRGIDLIDIKSGAMVNLTLTGKNKLDNQWLYSAIHVPYGAILNITRNSTGSLVASANGNGAGIGASGSDSKGATGTIIIDGGTITAIGGYGECGIGGGASDRNAYEINESNYTGGGTIIINGGTVTAIGGRDGGSHAGAAGIGGASLTRQGRIVINGGRVTASSMEAGIGGESRHGKGNVIVIAGGIVTANGDNYASGIGNTLNPSGTTVTVCGGTITAKGDYGSRTIYEAYIKDTREYLDSLKAYDIAAESTVITGGNLNAHTFLKQPVDSKGKLLYHTYVNCKEGNITSISLNGKTFGSRNVMSSGYLSLYLPAGSHRLKVYRDNSLLTDERSFLVGYGNSAVCNIKPVLNMMADISKGNLELIDGGCIYQNQVYRCENILVRGTTDRDKLLVHADGDRSRSVVFKDLSVDYQKSGEQDFLVLDNDITLMINLSGDNSIVLGGSSRGMFVGNGSELCFTGQDSTDNLQFRIGEKSKAIYTNIGNVMLYSGGLNFQLANEGTAVYTGNYGTFTLNGGSFEVKSAGGGSAITGLSKFRVNIHGGTMLADTVGMPEDGNEEVSLHTVFTMTGGSIHISGRLIFSDYLIYGGKLNVRMLGCGTGCSFTMYNGSLEAGAFINYDYDRANQDENPDGRDYDITRQNLLGGDITIRNDVDERELEDISYGKG